MIFRFRFRVGNPLQAFQKYLLGPDKAEIDLVVLTEHVLHLLSFTLSQDPVIDDEDAGELFTDRLMQKQCAATDESTPPLKPRMTRPSPTWVRISSMASRAKDFMVQDFWHLQIPKRKFSSIFFPSWVWTTSGWNWKP